MTLNTNFIGLKVCAIGKWGLSSALNSLLYLCTNEEMLTEKKRLKKYRHIINLTRKRGRCHTLMPNDLDYLVHDSTEF
jgi:hypothetical protein